MNRERYQRLQAIFDEAVELEGDKRRGFLESACAEDDELRRDVEQLLAQDEHEDRGEFEPVRFAEAVQQEATVRGPSLMTFDPGGIVSGLPKTFVVSGGGFGPVGEVVQARFTAPASTPFHGGTSAVLEILAGVTSSTEVQGTIPAEAVVELFFESGATTTSGEPFVTFTPELKLWATEGDPGDHFGHSVDISAGGAIVGAPGDGENGLDSGAVYLFPGGGTSWTEQQKLLTADGSAGDQFGWAVAITDGCAIVGAPNDDDQGLSSGSVYVFESDGSTWTEAGKLLPSDGATQDYFGQSVAISGQSVVAGAPARRGCSVGFGSLRAGVLLEQCQRPLHVRGPQVEAVLSHPRAGAAVGVLDVDLLLRQRGRQAGERSGLVREIHEDDVVLEREHAVIAEQVQGVLRLVDHHAQRSVVERVQESEAEDVDLLLGQSLRDSSEGSRMILQNNDDLLDDLHVVPS